MTGNSTRLRRKNVQNISIEHNTEPPSPEILLYSVAYINNLQLKRKDRAGKGDRPRLH